MLDSIDISDLGAGHRPHRTVGRTWGWTPRRTALGFVDRTFAPAQPRTTGRVVSRVVGQSVGGAQGL